VQTAVAKPSKPSAKASSPAKAPAKQVANARPPAQPKPAPAASTAPKLEPKAPPAAASGAWRIQLGAFSQKGSAEALYRKLGDKPALQGRHAFYIPVGAITRLQAGPFESRSAAQAACNSLGVPCFPVAAK
jgi:cell division septation protein DedD